MPRYFSAKHLIELRKIGEDKCGTCFCYNNLRAAGADEIHCLACGSVCHLTLDQQGRVLEHWPKGLKA